MPCLSLPPLTVLDLIGVDAAKILNNLSTAPILTLEWGEGCETFITDVRGRTLGHVCVYRLRDRLRLIGAAGQGPVITAHADRYTIREDVRAEDHSETWTGLLLDETAIRRIDATPDPALLVATEGPGDLIWRPLATDRAPVAESPDEVDGLFACRVPWTAAAPLLLVGPTARLVELRDGPLAGDDFDAGPDAFQRARVAKRFPWHGIDLDDRNLPQEADRDAQAISFTKGCYLGQETVARLDALGQVQKKLVGWRIEAAQPPPTGTELVAEGRVVGRLTSVVPGQRAGEFLAIGFARRSHFEAGAKAAWEINGQSVGQASVEAN